MSDSQNGSGNFTQTPWANSFGKQFRSTQKAKKTADIKDMFTGQSTKDSIADDFVAALTVNSNFLGVSSIIFGPFSGEKMEPRYITINHDKPR